MNTTTSSKSSLEITTKNNILHHLYGIIIIAVGIFLVFAKQYTFSTVKYTLGISLTVAAIIALATALIRKPKRVQFAYHQLHGLALFVYGILVLAFAYTFDTLSYLTAFLLFFYAFSEIIFCSYLFNLRSKINFKILIFRLFLGLIVGIGTAAVINYYYVNKSLAFEGCGILFIIIGANVILYEPVMKSEQTTKQ